MSTLAQWDYLIHFAVIAVGGCGIRPFELLFSLLSPLGVPVTVRGQFSHLMELRLGWGDAPMAALRGGGMGRVATSTGRGIERETNEEAESQGESQCGPELGGSHDTSW